MAREQLGAAPSAANHAATKGYVDDEVATRATNKHTFSPGSTPGTRRWTHLLTIDGKSAQGGGYANFLLSGTGDYGGANRGTVLVHAAQRGDNGFSVKAWGWNVTSTNAPVELFAIQTSTLVFQVWARFAAYNQAHELHLLGQNNATIILASQDATPASTVAYPIVHMDAMSPDTHGHALTDSNITGTLPIAQLPVAGSGTSSSTLIVRADDSRLSNARTPTAHGHALTDANITGTLPIAQLPVASSGTSSSTSIVRADDSRLSNSRTPTAHTHTLTDLPDAWVKRSVRVATTANITLSGTQTVDGIALVAADRVLVKNQTTTSQNGIYTVATGAWTRSTGTDSSAELAGATVNVDQGGQAGQLWTNNFPSTGVIGTTAVTWSRVLDTSLLAANGGTTAGTVVQADDSRLSNARTPTAHGHVLTDANITGVLPIAQIPVASSGTSNSTQVVRADDSRLSNARTPTTHGHVLTDSNITGVLPIAQIPVASSGTSNSTQVVRADDSRLSNARTPAAHGHALTDANMTGVLPWTQTPTADRQMLSRLFKPTAGPGDVSLPGVFGPTSCEGVLQQAGGAATATLKMGTGFVYLSPPPAYDSLLLRTSSQDFTITRPASNARRDLIYAEGVMFGTSPGARYGIVTGTPAASPVTPSPPADTTPIGSVYVPASTAQVMVWTDLRVFTGLQGGMVMVPNEDALSRIQADSGYPFLAFVVDTDTVYRMPGKVGIDTQTVPYGRVMKTNGFQSSLSTSQTAPTRVHMDISTAEGGIGVGGLPTLPFIQVHKPGRYEIAVNGFVSSGANGSILLFTVEIYQPDGATLAHRLHVGRVSKPDAFDVVFNRTLSRRLSAGQFVTLAASRVGGDVATSVYGTATSQESTSLDVRYVGA